MFHNNFKIYQTNFGEYSIEVEFWDYYADKVETMHLENLNEDTLNKFVDLLTKLDFDDRTPEKE